jgi:acetylornithine deacetylase/succinyl-diaminopimelate desuccinylase-like protein
MATPVHGDAPVLARAHASLEDVLPAIVRRIAWAGDGRKGSLRLEFGAGALAGGTLVVHADDGRVKVELRAPPGTDAAAWRDRIAARLEEKRIRVDEIVVE